MQIGQPQPLAEHAPADDEHVGGGKDLAYPAARAFQRGHGVQQAAELHRGHQRHHQGDEHGRALAVGDGRGHQAYARGDDGVDAGGERQRPEAAGDGRRALIIGGAGKMGGWFVDYFSSQGFLTVIADTGVKAGPGRCRDWRQAGIDYDVIVVATPMAVSGQILKDLAELQPEGLIFDIGSLKSPLKDGLGALRDAGCRVASLHPMYGPDTELLSGRHLIFIDVGCPEATAQVKNLFSATMVEELDMGLEDHDRLIAYVLGLSHALNIAFFTALAESGEAAPKLARLSSTTFDAQLLVSGAVARDNPRMYFEIQNLNDFGMDPLDALCDSAAKIREVVASGDEDGFVKLMQKGREYLATRK